MTKLEMIEYVHDSYVTDDDWKRLVIKEYGSLEKFVKSITKDEAKEMYEQCKATENTW